MSPRSRLSLFVILLAVGALALLLGRQSVPPATNAPPAGAPYSEPPPPGLRAVESRKPDLVAEGREGAEGERASADAPDPDEDVRVSLRVDVVDAHTGRDVEATWNLGTGHVVAGPFPPGVEITDVMLEQSRAGVAAAIREWNAGFLRAGAWKEDAFPWAQRVVERYVVRPARGYVLQEQVQRMVADLAAGMTRARILIPVWPEAELDLEVTGPDGKPLEGVGLFGLQVAGHVLGAQPEVLGPGRYRIRGLPHMAGEPVFLRTWGPATTLLPKDILPEWPQALTSVPQDLARPWRADVRLKAARGPEYEEIDEEPDHDGPMGLGDAGPPRPSSASVRARVEARVTDEEGRPRPFARLEIPGRIVLDVTDGVQRLDMFTDVAGRRVLERVQPGRARIRAVWGSRVGVEVVDLRDGETTRVTIVVR